MLTLVVWPLHLRAPIACQERCAQERFPGQSSIYFNDLPRSKHQGRAAVERCENDGPMKGESNLGISGIAYNCLISTLQQIVEIGDLCFYIKMDSHSPAPEDPLLAALPPATDYMTYLTLLEYQLNVQNLPTLTRLLAEDDGSLAREIGWDLLRLVLAMLEETPAEASKCLEVIAQRGNPREVVVRVAEELEKLAQDTDSSDAAEEVSDQETDELPTFAGEATRIHLGRMTLDGTPETAQRGRRGVDDHTEDEATTETAETSGDASRLQALLMMLSIVHPRIRTQYPSRFLATSLPAALGAYRRIPCSPATTSAFLALLSKLAGTRPPSLPPRPSSLAGPAPLASGPAGGPAITKSTPPLPDPEAAAEVETGVNIGSETEKKIILRLLQAVMLEILDEYTSSFQSGDCPCLSWTARLREKFEPKRILPGRLTETERWETTPELKARDRVMMAFDELSRDLHVDLLSQTKAIVDAEGKSDTDVPSTAETEVSEYPTSPSQIPFPPTGVVLLYADQQYLRHDGSSPSVSQWELAQLFTSFFPVSAAPTVPSAPLQDALLSLLYGSTQLSVEASQSADRRQQPDAFVRLLSSLTQSFTITPHPHLRDDAHHIATRLLHSYPRTEVRLEIIQQTVRGVSGSDEAEQAIPLAPPMQTGVLKAVAVDWLKDEFLSHFRHGASTDVGMDPGILSTDETLAALLFPRLSLPNESQIDEFLLTVPFYISSMNLLCVLLSHARGLPVIDAAAGPLLVALESWLDFLVELVNPVQGHTQIQTQTENDDQVAIAESMPDIYALDDACRRARGAIDKRS